MIDDPGANISRHVPKFEKLERESEIVVEPTVITVGSEAGVLPQASPELFPAETAVITPLLCKFAAASFTD